MAEVVDAVDQYLSKFEEFERQTGPGAWLGPLRKAAMSRFAEVGFPTTDDEEWRYTNVAPIAATTFESAPQEGAASATIVQPYRLGANVPTAVCINGRFSAPLSSLAGLPKGVRVLSLRRAIEQEDETVRAHLARHTKYAHQPFTALNTALMEDGVLVHVSRGTVVDCPIHCVHLATRGKKPWMANPRMLIVAAENSQVTVIEEYAGQDGAAYFHNAVTELVALENAVVDHYKVSRETDAAFHIGTIQLHQHRNSNVHSFAATFGGGLVRNNINTVLDGEGCDCGLNGLYMVDARQHVDNHLLVEHAKPHCDSREFFKGILDGAGKGIFAGRIIVRPGAQKTDAKQTNMSLLLSRDAQVESKPQLEIFADDVKCTHGATIGQINDEAVFYLRTRGIEEHAARGLLVYAFANDVLERVKVDPLRIRLEQLVLTRLPERLGLKELP